MESIEQTALGALSIERLVGLLETTASKDAKVLRNLLIWGEVMYGGVTLREVAERYSITVGRVKQAALWSEKRLQSLGAV
jgi:DNA-directed RNA polymerase sigma subunit (sigma70/sigma32)|tara:strand:- start:2840 stop:3079 length:240 start_codon:yes stop_codon:yes gene_type:complete